MTARRHFDRLAQPRQGEALVLSPAAPYFAASPDPLAPIGLEDIAASQPLEHSPPGNAAPLPPAAPITPALSPAPRHLARKIAPAAPAPANHLAPPGPAPAMVSQPAPAAAPLSGAPQPAASPPPARTTATPGIAAPHPPTVAAGTGDLSVVPMAAAAIQPPAPAAMVPPAPSDPAAAPWRAMAAPGLDPAPPRRLDAVLTPAPAARKPTPDLGMAGLGAWLDGAASPSPAPAAGGIHIGVVEVRVSPPAPAPAPPVQVRAPVAAPGAQPALARGYGWRFGLGQS